MLKKSLNAVALASLLFTGVGITAAQADTAFVNSDYLAGAGISASFSSTDEKTVPIPENIQHFRSQAKFELAAEFLEAHAGQTLSYTVSVTGPTGSVLKDATNGSPNNAASYNKFSDGYIGKFPSYAYVDYQTGTLAIPATVTGWAGYFTPSVDVNAANYNTGGTLVAGDYTLVFNLLANGENVNDADGVTVKNLDNNMQIDGVTGTLPAGTTSTSFFAEACADPAKIAVGDVLKSEFYVDGVKSSSNNASWRTRNGFKSSSDPDYRNGNYVESVTVTQYDVTNGVYASANNFRNDLVAGTSHTISMKLFNSSTTADVSGDCAPAKPTAPTATYSSNQIRSSGTLSFGTGYGSYCYAFDKANPNVVAATAYLSSGGPGSDQYTCNIGGLTTGHTYVVKVRTGFNGKLSAYSDASPEVLIPAGGYTISTQYAGVLGAGKVMKVHDNNIPIEDLGSYTQTIPDGKGGIYTFASNYSCTMMCGATSARIRHISGNNLDPTFGGTGSIVLNSFTPKSAQATTFGYYGTGKDKWVAPIAGFEDNGVDPTVQLIFGNTANATTTTKSINKATLLNTCNSAASGYGLRPMYSANLFAIGAPTANPLFQITCWKQYTMADTTQIWNSIQVLVTADPATGALTVKGALGTPSASANGFSARFTINSSATGNEPMLTALVTSHLYTAYNTMNNQYTGTVADHSIIRFKSDLTVISTTNSAWGTAGGNSSIDPMLFTSPVNAGVIYAFSRSTPTSSSLIKITATGAAAAPIAIDQSASTIVNGFVNAISGNPIASNETLIPVSIMGMGEIAAGWVNATTGVLTQGEKLAYVNVPGAGSMMSWLAGNDKNTYLLISLSNAPNNITVLKWVDSRYTAPSGPIPTVTSKNLKYAKNTPAAGTKVTLTGTNLNGVTSAKIGGVTAALGTKSATSLILTVPNATSAGTVDIVLTTATGSTTVDTFTYVGSGVAQNVTITTDVSTGTVGNPDVTLAGTVSATPADAGTVGAISWSSTTPAVCTVSATGTLSYVASGTCTVKATAAASGLLLAGETIKNITVNKGTQTITFTPPTNPQVDLDGIDLIVVSSAGLPLTYTTSTPSVCTVDADGKVIASVAGDCTITAAQAGNGSWLEASQSLTFTFAAADTTPIVDLGDPSKPTAAPSNGTWVLSRGVYVTWNRTKGTLGLKHNIVYTGPVTATATFKIGTKSYSCVVNYGITKTQASAKKVTLTSPNLCSAAKESATLAALKKAPANTVVKIVMVRDMRVPTTYAKYRLQTKTLYIKLG